MSMLILEITIGPLDPKGRLLPTGTQELSKAHAADILASSDFAAQIHAAQANNDYVIIDTPALGEYNDALQVAQFADATLYVAKAGKTKKSDIESLNVETHLPHPMLILNN